MAARLEPMVAAVLHAAFEGVGSEVLTAGRDAVVHHPHICCARHLDEAGLLCLFAGQLRLYESA